MYTRNIAVKLIVMVLSLGLLIYPAFAYGPQEEILDLELNEVYVELEYGYEAPLDMRGFQFLASREGGNCPDLVWTLSDTEFLKVSEEGYVSVCNGQGRLDGDKLITLSCSTADGCVQGEAQIMLLAPPAKGGPPLIPSGIAPKPSMYNTYSDMTMDYIVPLNKLSVIKYNRNKQQAPKPAPKPTTFFDYNYTFDYKSHLMQPKNTTSIGPNEVSPHVSVVLNTEAIKLYYGGYTTPDQMTYDFDAFVIGSSYREVQWEVSDDQFIEVDEKGVVRLKAIPPGTGDFTVKLTVSTMDGWKTDTALISIFEK